MKTHPDGPNLRLECKQAGTPTAYMEAEEQCLFLEGELLSRGGSDSERAWVIDLSEYVDGATLALAGMLAGFREKARRQGCDVKYTGLMNGCADAQLESG